MFTLFRQSLVELVYQTLTSLHLCLDVRLESSNGFVEAFLRMLSLRNLTKCSGPTWMMGFPPVNPARFFSIAPSNALISLVS